MTYDGACGVQRPVSVWELCLERERLLREVGFSDAYAHVKHNENKAALCLLPALLRVRKTDACALLAWNCFYRTYVWATLCK